MNRPPRLADWALVRFGPRFVRQDVLGDLHAEYQKNEQPVSKSNELLTVKFRYKKPLENKSRLIVSTLNDSGKSWERASEDFRWSAAVAEFGMLMRDSEFKGQSSHSQVLAIAGDAKGSDEEGYRSEFVRMVKSLELMAQR